MISPILNGRLEDDVQFVRFTALKLIADGEEIFQNYGDEYWATRC